MITTNSTDAATTATGHPATPDAPADPGLRTTVAVGAVLAAIGSLGYIAVVILYPGQSPREDYLTPMGVAGCLIATAGIMIIIYGLIRGVVPWPAWILRCLAAGLFFAAANAWVSGTTIPGLAAAVDDATFDGMAGPSLMTSALPKIILCAVGAVSMAVVGIIRRTGGVVATIALVLAAVASVIPPFPPGVLMFSVALLVLLLRPVTQRR